MGVTAAQLQRYRVLVAMLFEMAVSVAMNDCAAGNHFCVEHRMLTDEPEKITTKPVGPVHHRGNAEFSINRQRVASKCSF